MRVSFDLDGVITNSEKWAFATISGEAELMYYATRSVRYNPYLFLSEGDAGFIITARKPVSKAITERWLRSNGIVLPIVFIDPCGTIDWTDYRKASIESGQRKAAKIDGLGVRVHFDNNPVAVATMRRSLPSVSIIQVGGEPYLSSAEMLGVD